MSGKRILVVEDDADSASILEAYLLRDGFIVGLAENGQRGIDMHRQWRPDLVLLDVMLPLVSGTDVLSAIRRCSDTPVIMVTAMGDEPEKLGALRYGADDYVVKPYNPKEVVARVHAVLRRAQPGGSAERQLRYQDLVVDLDAVTARIEGLEQEQTLLDLTPTEFKILCTLLKTPSKAFTREELLEICLPESEALARVVDAHVHNLRRKLELHGIDNVLVTVRAVGYRFR
ncbi:response regulator [Pseudomonas viridiflava]|uniref:Response regulator receiver:transcriptional regulatory protein, C-terminal n=3 Tax=Pseudomonas viridiflava TaxID=33069 RepID=A0A1Y6JNR8_PSEVI|nr:response regulator [Pseudomonas viridiflava]MCI3910085.1 response regulator [Pseudomonas viridiflava]WKW31164.1 response regulator [Pseudomonas viridiflava]SMS09963.1 response regulator receiver:transcriptional regulatory protein, C-terminal [Pseudomonas viridiflava]VVN81990.1 Transcriptional regulatory protein BaeR [Pseudomonas fluorescens]